MGGSRPILHSCGAGAARLYNGVDLCGRRACPPTCRLCRVGRAATDFTLVSSWAGGAQVYIPLEMSAPRPILHSCGAYRDGDAHAKIQWRDECSQSTIELKDLRLVRFSVWRVADSSNKKSYINSSAHPHTFVLRRRPPNSTQI